MKGRSWLETLVVCLWELLTKSPCFNVKLLMSDIFFSFLSFPACTDHRLHCKYCHWHTTSLSGSAEMKISTFCVAQICSRRQCVIRNHGVFCHFRQPCKSKDRPPAFVVFVKTVAWPFLHPHSTLLASEHFLHVMAFLIISELTVKDRQCYSRSPNRMGMFVSCRKSVFFETDILKSWSR